MTDKLTYTRGGLAGISDDNPEWVFDLIANDLLWEECDGPDLVLCAYWKPTGKRFVLEPSSTYMRSVFKEQH